MPAAVVIYSYILPGNKSAVTIEALKPIAASTKEGRGSFRNFSNFLVKTFGASPSLAIVTSKFTTANKEALIVENPAMMIAPLNTWGKKVNG
ncbi:Uncharacterised protein [Actinobacillus pleuropneumoniae]|nr:Uncharacterised protein [Actinobacillus pleuropneumoniae]